MWSFPGPPTFMFAAYWLCQIENRDRVTFQCPVEGILLSEESGVYFSNLLHALLGMVCIQRMIHVSLLKQFSPEYSKGQKDRHNGRVRGQ